MGTGSKEPRSPSEALGKLSPLVKAGSSVQHARLYHKGNPPVRAHLCDQASSSLALANKNATPRLDLRLLA